MDDLFEEIMFTDVDYPEDNVKISGFPTYVTIRGFEYFERDQSQRTKIRITPEQARQLATFLSDYADQQGV